MSATFEIDLIATEISREHVVTFTSSDGRRPFIHDHYRYCFNQWADAHMDLRCRGASKVPYRPYRFHDNQVIFDDAHEAMIVYLAFAA